MQSTTDSKISSGYKKARRGVSLIEVLVVLVILVTGILVIIRLYPSGFFSVQSVGNAAVADSLGAAELQAAQQNFSSLPEAIQPGGMNAAFPGGMNDYGQPQAGAMDASYDPEFNASQEPDYSATLNKARLIVNETITVPTASAGSRQSVYVTKFGPIVTQEPINAPQPYTPIPNATFLSVNGTFWQPVRGTFNTSVPPQDSAPVGSQQFVVDLANKRIAVPYAAYDPSGMSYAQPMIVIITAGGIAYTQYLNIPAANTNTPYGPDGRTFLPDSTSSYQGGWFDPTGATPTGVIPASFDYGDGANAHVNVPPTNVAWDSVAVYRRFKGIDTTAAFSLNDPYQFKLISPDLPYTGPALPQPQPHYNLGGIAFNPIAGGGVGYNALKAQISYRVADWKVIHEDRDVPALSGTNTSVLRLSLKNLRRAGDALPDDKIDPGLLSSGHSMYIMDLDTGQLAAPVAPPSTYDPTVFPDPNNYPLIDEDVDGPNPDRAAVNVSYAIGRLTFASNSFGDNPNGTTPHAHRVRIFYAGDLDWTVAVQKAPAYYVLDNFMQPAFPTNGILPGHCFYDTNTQSLLFPQSDAGKTVEVDGSPDQPGQTAAIGDAVTNMGGVNYVSLPYSLDATKITAVRGLSARAVVAWQERGQWKSHSVDTILNRTP